MEFENREKVWTVRCDGSDDERDAAIAKIADSLGISNICALLLYNRGYRTVEEADAFLKNESSLLHDPYMLKDVIPAVERIKKAIDDGEKMVIYGDYDVDGVTSVTLMYLYFSSLGADIGYYIPSRNGEGYGVSKAAIDRLKAKGVSLIVTVDTGITANEEAEYAKSLGIDMVVTDHHECQEMLPDASAVVNPHRPDCPYPFKELAGVGVVFKVICAYEKYLCELQGTDYEEALLQICNQYADLVAIGTVADVMPIKDENRKIVTMGLKMIAETNRMGLKALIDATTSGGSDKKKKITSGFIGYGIAPRINAAGRIDNVTKAVELLLTDDPEMADALAENLCDINRQRQIEENRIADQAYKKIEETHDFENDKVIVLEDNSWHQGVVGIVASRITERYGLPSILISFDGSTRGFDSPDDMGKGSCRSIKGMNLVDALSYCDKELYKYGGHELAAGLTVLRENVDAFRRRINEYARENLDDSALSVHIEADCEIPAKTLTLPFVSELYKLEPYGVGNPAPVFVMHDCVLKRIIPIGAGKHLKLLIEKDGITLSSVYFGMTEYKLGIFETELCDIIFTVDINEYQGNSTVQLVLQDARRAKSVMTDFYNAHRRYAEIRSGAEFADDEEVVPTREDFAMVYTVLRKEFRMGFNTLTERNIQLFLKRDYGKTISYIKLKYIIAILQELKICDIVEEQEDLFHFEIYFNAKKTNIEKSSILKKLKSQCKSRA